jgi:hypothetical protein
MRQRHLLGPDDIRSEIEEIRQTETECNLLYGVAEFPEPSFIQTPEGTQGRIEQEITGHVPSANRTLALSATIELGLDLGGIFEAVEPPRRGNFKTTGYSA